MQASAYACTHSFCGLYIQEGDAYEVIPGTEFSITRTAHRDNTSKYYINSRKATMNDVADALKSKGIDLNFNRFLILQGEVELISMMKPKGQTEHEDGLLEYLEDIIGSNSYKELIAAAEKEVEAFNETRFEQLNRMKMVEQERDNLEVPPTCTSLSIHSHSLMHTHTGCQD